MPRQIEAIFLDIGNTLRTPLPDEAHQGAARARLAQMVGTDLSADEFCAEVDRRYKGYKKWANDSNVEAHEPELWTRWLAPEFPAAEIAPQAVELTYLYRQTMGKRVVMEGGRQVIIELATRGYILGIISNVITSREIPDWLKADGLDGYFKSMALSSVLGIRKPHPAIYRYAASQAGVDPSGCAYVGDNLDRDVTGTRNAGFGMVIILQDPAEKDVLESCDDIPDLIIQRLSDLLAVFPARQLPVS